MLITWKTYYFIYKTKMKSQKVKLVLKRKRLKTMKPNCNYKCDFQYSCKHEYQYECITIVNLDKIVYEDKLIMIGEYLRLLVEFMKYQSFWIVWQITL